MKILKKLNLATLILATCFFYSNIQAQKIASLELGDAIEIQVQVCGVFKSDRSLWVFVPGDPDNVYNYYISEDAQNFDQIEVGDMIDIAYYESVVVSLNAPGELPDENETDILVRAEKGEKPAGIAVDIHNISAIVQAYDPETGVASLMGPKGNILKTLVSDAVYESGIIKVGQTVHVSYTQTLAISVEKVD